MPQALNRSFKGIVAVATIILLIIGVPLALIKFVGWPLWRTAPDLANTSAWFSSSTVNDSVVINALAVTAWVFWILLAFSFIVELVAVVTGKAAVKVPFAGPMQPLARQLIAVIGVALTASTLLGAKPVLASTINASASISLQDSNYSRYTSEIASPVSGVSPGSSVAAPVAGMGGSSSIQAQAGVSSQGESQTPKSVTVKPRDTLWDLAEKHLGNPLRWHEIYELNVGKPQPQGRTLNNPDLIRPGWILTMPGDAINTDLNKVSAQSTSNSAPKSIKVKPGDTLWDLAEKHLGDPLRWHEIFDMNVGSPQPLGRTLRNPDLINPGWTLKLPADAIGVDSADALPQTTPTPITPSRPVVPPAPAMPVDPNIPPTTAAPVTTAPPTTATPTTIPETETENSSAPSMNSNVSEDNQTSSINGSTVAPPVSNLTPSTTAPGSGQQQQLADQSSSKRPVFPLVLSGLLAAAVLGALAGFRLRNRRRRRVNTVQVLPEAAPVIEQAVEVQAQLSTLSWIEIALRSLSFGISKRPRATWPLPHAVLASEKEIEVLLGTGSHFDTPAPWYPAKGGWSWMLERSTNETSLRSQVGRYPNPLPAMVSLGNSDAGELFVDLEAFGSISLLGQAVDINSFAKVIALELAGAHLRGDSQIQHVEVIAVGLHVPTLPGFAHIRSAASLDDLLPELESRSRAMGDSLAAVQRPNTFAGRAGAFGDDFNFDPIVILVDVDRASVPAAHRAAELANGGGLGTAIVFLGDSPAANWTFDVGPETVAIASLGVSVVRTRIQDNDIQAASMMLSAASAEPHMVTDPVIVSNNKESSENIDLRSDVVAHEVEIRVIGEIDVVNVQGRLPFTKAMELVAYLTFHRDVTSVEALSRALFPGQQPDGDLIRNLADEANALLGAPSSGGAYVMRVIGGYKISRLVATDMDAMQNLAKLAATKPSTEAILILSDALDMVRGTPFERVMQTDPANISDGFAWARSERLVEKVDAVVVDISHQLAELCLDAGEAPGALWAVRQGLIGSPGNEMLYCDRMLAYYLAQDKVGIEETMRELERYMAQTTPGEIVSNETRSLFALLMRDENKPAEVQS